MLIFRFLPNNANNEEKKKRIELAVWQRIRSTPNGTADRQER